MTVLAEKPKKVTPPKVAPRKVAVVVHQEQSRPGRVGALLEKRGYELHRLCPNLGCNLPEDMSDYAGAVIFGGPMSANDCGTLAGIKCELDWIPKVIEAGVPYLGLCLGAQLLTRAAGGSVGPHPEGKIEIGYVDVEPTEAGRAWFPGPMKVYQWHREGMTLPDCCELLVTNDTYPTQGFRCGANAFGFQFHPEVTLEMKKIWTLSAAERLRMPGAQQRGVHLSMHPLYDPPLDRWINGFLDRWLATDRRELPSEPLNLFDPRSVEPLLAAE
jgi:GMP synthase (glutamine-hydrolysing)